MRRSKPISAGVLWDEIVAGNGRMARHLLEARLPQVWTAVVGEPIANATEDVELKNGVLNVRIASSVLRSEVFIHRMRLAKSKNGQ